ncbi:MAG: rhomboid family intramembrane serine protease, partial [Myxococcales bacterium]|nr:rhomboid family intramembrane serine protease [Myxococcales bacterium]
DARLSGPLASRIKRALRLVVPEGTYTYTSALVALNIAFYLAMLMRAHGGPSLDAFSKGISLPVLIRFGGIVPEALAQGQIWRLVTPVFLHGGLLHVLFNCLWLVSLGPLIEHHYGRGRFIVLYVASGVAGFALSAAGHWGSPVVSVGSSGSIFGLMAAAVVAGYVRRIPGSDELRGGNLVKWIVLACVLSFLPRVDYFAHLGGGVAGALLTFFYAPRTQVRRLPDRLWLLLEVLTVGVVIAAFAFAWAAGPRL